MVDYSATTEIEVVNESSYNLRIIFESVPPYLGFDEKIDVAIGESVSFNIFSGLGGKDVEPRNPNSELIKISFVNLDTDEIIKEIDNMRKDTIFFEYINSEPYQAWYQFRINEDFNWTETF
jgi:hypothetical protein